MHLLAQPEVVIEPEPKTLLQNKLQRSRAKLAELIPQIEDKCAPYAYMALFPLNPIDCSSRCRKADKARRVLQR